MAAKETRPNGKSQLIRDLKNGEFAPLYIISGEESYLKEYYLRQLRQKVVDETFADFNLIEFEGKALTPEALTEAIDSVPEEEARSVMNDIAARYEVLPNVDYDKFYASVRASIVRHIAAERSSRSPQSVSARVIRAASLSYASASFLSFALTETPRSASFLSRRSASAVRR